VAIQTSVFSNDKPPFLEKANFLENFGVLNSKFE